MALSPNGEALKGGTVLLTTWSELSADDFNWITIDPGDRHVGVAKWVGTHCFEAYETNPGGLTDYLIATAAPFGLVGFERFILDPRRARIQAGSEFGTSQLIGQIKLICQMRDWPCEGYTNKDGKATYTIAPWNTWPLRRFTSYGHGGHAKDAEMAGYSLMRRARKKAGLTDAQWAEMK